ncbi:hypothetical protein K1719_040977 [Acacia pycnantha]|nr:hypothetical protein K1719_040977 [Acacia pycnantha]
MSVMELYDPSSLSRHRVFHQLLRSVVASNRIFLGNCSLSVLQREVVHEVDAFLEPGKSNNVVGFSKKRKGHGDLSEGDGIESPFPTLSSSVSKLLFPTNQAWLESLDLLVLLSYHVDQTFQDFSSYYT